MEGFSLRDLLVAVLSSTLTTVGALILWFINIRQYQANLVKTRAEARKFDAEADDLTSARIFREIDRLAAINDEQAALIANQRTEIENLRTAVQGYADRERSHAAEDAVLRQRIVELEESLAGIGSPAIASIPLKTTYPPIESPHEANEFDRPKNP